MRVFSLTLIGIGADHFTPGRNVVRSQRFSVVAACAAAAALFITALTPSNESATAVTAPSAVTVTNSVMADPGWNVIERPVPSHTARLTVALVAPPGTQPNFSRNDALWASDAAASFLRRETDGRVTVVVEQVTEWMFPPNNDPCSWSGTWQDYAAQQLGWQREPGRHLTVMVPNGAPCPGWANGEQGWWGINTGGRTFQPGFDPMTLVHELGHNMSQFHSASMGCNEAWDFSTLGAGVPENCWRTEYGNRLDVMGGAWTFNPYPSPTLDRIGMLPRHFEPNCGAIRTMNVTSVGAGATNRESISFADPRDPNARYWVDFRARDDANIYNYMHGSQWSFKPTRDGLQIMRNDPNQWGAPIVLSRPYDGDDHRQLTGANERITLGGGAWVEYKGNTSGGEGIVEVFVPCRAFEAALTAQHSQLCLDNTNWSSANGNVQSQYGCSNAAVQRFVFISVPGVANTYTVINRHSGKCLDVNGISQADGAAVQQWTCTGGANQQFELRKAGYAGASPQDYQLVARHSGKCVDVAGISATPGEKTVQWSCYPNTQSTNLNQTWRLTNQS